MSWGSKPTQGDIIERSSKKKNLFLFYLMGIRRHGFTTYLLDWLKLKQNKTKQTTNRQYKLPVKIWKNWNHQAWLMDVRSTVTLKKHLATPYKAEHTFNVQSMTSLLHFWVFTQEKRKHILIKMYIQLL